MIVREPLRRAGNEIESEGQRACVAGGRMVAPGEAQPSLGKTQP
jgi:hypothetical protein